MNALFDSYFRIIRIRLDTLLLLLLLHPLSRVIAIAHVGY